MRKFFDRKAPNTSKDCNKLSKSVSHKTLVDGTATIVNAYEQTQHLNKGSANAPLDAEGTFSAISDAVKVVEKSLQTSLDFKLVKIFSLVAVFCMSNINESQAAISCVFSDGGKTVTITGEKSDTVGWNACQANNSKDENGNNYTPPSNYRETITSANIGSGIESIGDMAFYQAANLTSITIPEGVTSIGNSAFTSSGLTSITLPNSLSSIGNNAFQGLQNLNSIKIPKNVESIGQYAFVGASGLTNVTFADNSKIKTLERGVFQGTGITSIALPEGLEEIGIQAFMYSSDLVSVTLPSTLTTIGNSAFSDATSLTSINIPDAVTNIVSNAFDHCNNLQELAIWDTLTEDVVAEWSEYLFHSKNFTSVRCIDRYGNDSTNESNCIKALGRFLYDENGNCSVRKCLAAQKIGNTCVGQYFGSVSGDGTCTQAGLCKAYGNYINTDTRQCMTPESCTGMYVADTVNKKCFKMPGCVNYADNACQECDSGYLRQSGACVEESACNGRNYASGDECKEMPEGCAKMSGDSCATCDGEHLEKNGSCISASAGCGAGYRQFENWCNRIQYTPAEAAPLLNDDNNTVTITFRK